MKELYDLIFGKQYTSESSFGFNNASISKIIFPEGNILIDLLGKNSMETVLSKDIYKNENLYKLSLSDSGKIHILPAITNEALFDKETSNGEYTVLNKDSRYISADLGINSFSANNIEITGNLSVSGKGTLGSLETIGSATIGNGLTVSKGNVSVENGNLSVSGKGTLGSLETIGSATIGNGLTVSAGAINAEISSMTIENIISESLSTYKLSVNIPKGSNINLTSKKIDGANKVYIKEEFNTEENTNINLGELNIEDNLSVKAITVDEYEKDFNEYEEPTISVESKTYTPEVFTLNVKTPDDFKFTEGNYTPEIVVPEEPDDAELPSAPSISDTIEGNINLGNGKFIIDEFTNSVNISGNSASAKFTTAVEETSTELESASTILVNDTTTPELTISKWNNGTGFAEDAESDGTNPYSFTINTGEGILEYHDSPLREERNYEFSIVELNECDLTYQPKYLGFGEAAEHEEGEPAYEYVEGDDGSFSIEYGGIYDGKYKPTTLTIYGNFTENVFYPTAPTLSFLENDINGNQNGTLTIKNGNTENPINGEAVNVEVYLLINGKKQILEDSKLNAGSNKNITVPFNNSGRTYSVYFEYYWADYFTNLKSSTTSIIPRFTLAMPIVSEPTYNSDELTATVTISNPNAVGVYLLDENGNYIRNDYGDNIYIEKNKSIDYIIRKNGDYKFKFKAAYYNDSGVVNKTVSIDLKKAIITYDNTKAGTTTVTIENPNSCAVSVMASLNNNRKLNTTLSKESTASFETDTPGSVTVTLMHNNFNDSTTSSNVTVKLFEPLIVAKDNKDGSANVTVKNINNISISVYDAANNDEPITGLVNIEPGKTSEPIEIIGTKTTNWFSNISDTSTSGYIKSDNEKYKINPSISSENFELEINNNNTTSSTACLNFTNNSKVPVNVKYQKIGGNLNDYIIISVNAGTTSEITFDGVESNKWFSITSSLLSEDINISLYRDVKLRLIEPYIQGDLDEYISVGTTVVPKYKIQNDNSIPVKVYVNDSLLIDYLDASSVWEDYTLILKDCYFSPTEDYTRTRINSLAVDKDNIIYELKNPVVSVKNLGGKLEYTIDNPNSILDLTTYTLTYTFNDEDKVSNTGSGNATLTREFSGTKTDEGKFYLSDTVNNNNYIESDTVVTKTDFTLLEPVISNIEISTTESSITITNINAVEVSVSGAVNTTLNANSSTTIVKKSPTTESINFTHSKNNVDITSSKSHTFKLKLLPPKYLEENNGSMGSSESYTYTIYNDNDVAVGISAENNMIIDNIDAGKSTYYTSSNGKLTDFCCESKDDFHISSVLVDKPTERLAQPSVDVRYYDKETQITFKNTNNTQVDLNLYNTSDITETPIASKTLAAGISYTHTFTASGTYYVVLEDVSGIYFPSEILSNSVIIKTKLSAPYIIKDPDNSEYTVTNNNNYQVYCYNGSYYQGELAPNTTAVYTITGAYYGLSFEPKNSSDNLIGSSYGNIIEELKDPIINLTQNEGETSVKIKNLNSLAVTIKETQTNLAANGTTTEKYTMPVIGYSRTFTTFASGMTNSDTVTTDTGNITINLKPAIFEKINATTVKVTNPNIAAVKFNYNVRYLDETNVKNASPTIAANSSLELNLVDVVEKNRDFRFYYNFARTETGWNTTSNLYSNSFIIELLNVELYIENGKIYARNPNTFKVNVSGTLTLGMPPAASQIQITKEIPASYSIVIYDSYNAVLNSFYYTTIYYNSSGDILGQTELHTVTITSNNNKVVNVIKNFTPAIRYSNTDGIYIENITTLNAALATAADRDSTTIYVIPFIKHNKSTKMIFNRKSEPIKFGANDVILEKEITKNGNTYYSNLYRCQISNPDLVGSKRLGGKTLWTLDTNSGYCNNSNKLLSADIKTRSNNIYFYPDEYGKTYELSTHLAFGVALAVYKEGMNGSFIDDFELSYLSSNCLDIDKNGITGNILDDWREYAGTNGVSI